jgi:hypothetical protein
MLIDCTVVAGRSDAVVPLCSERTSDAHLTGSQPASVRKKNRDCLSDYSLQATIEECYIHENTGIIGQCTLLEVGIRIEPGNGGDSRDEVCIGVARKADASFTPTRVSKSWPSSVKP